MILDPDVSAALQAGNVPSTVSPEFLMQKRDQPARIALLFVLILTFVIVILRFISRWTVRRLGIDDAFAGFSVLLQIAFVVLGFYLIDLGTGRHLQYIEYVMTESQTIKSETLDFTAHLIYTSALFFCRISGLAFYRRLCELHDRLSLAIKIALVLLIAAYIPQMCLIIFHCKPVTGLWPYSWQQHSINYTCLTWGLVYTVNSGLSLVCDMLMFVIPVALIQTIALPPSRKLRLYVVLLPGVLVIIISVARLYLVVEGQWRPDSSWNYDPMLAIENSEIGGTLIALSIPGLKPLFDRFSSKVSGLHHSSRSHPPTFNDLNPSEIFRSEASKTSIVVEDRAMDTRPHPLSNPWASLGGGFADYGSRPSYASSTTSAASSSASSSDSGNKSTRKAGQEAAADSEDGTNPSHPWAASPVPFAYNMTPPLAPDV